MFTETSVVSRQLLIALKPLFVLNDLHNSVNDIGLLSMSSWMQTQ